MVAGRSKIMPIVISASPDLCNQTCLSDWIDARWDEPPEIFQAKPSIDPVEEDEYQEEYLKTTKSIMVKLINEDEFEEDDNSDSSKEDLLGPNIPQSEMTGLAKILAMSMRVLFVKCHPFIEGSFYTLVLRAMLELRQRSHSFPNLNMVTVNRMLGILQNCEKDTNVKFMLNGTECEDKAVVQSITNKLTDRTQNFHGDESSFRWTVYDPIVEAAWSAVDFVHGYCFDHFFQDMLHYSLYVKAMNEIFIQPVTQKHW